MSVIANTVDEDSRHYIYRWRGKPSNFPLGPAYGYIRGRNNEFYILNECRPDRLPVRRMPIVNFIAMRISRSVSLSDDEVDAQPTPLLKLNLNDLHAKS